MVPFPFFCFLMWDSSITAVAVLTDFAVSDSALQFFYLYQLLALFFYK